MDKSYSLSTDDNIQKIIDEALKELNDLQKEIEYLKSAQSRLQELTEKESKLLALINSLGSVINSPQLDKIKPVEIHDHDEKAFSKDLALNEVKKYLRVKNNLNYEIFKAVVSNNGKASTEQIKDFLVKHEIKQPKSGIGFEDVALKEISSRANYLVRKNILSASGNGEFTSLLGWKS